MTKLDKSSDLLVVGVITQAYGIKGWVKIKSFTEPESHILSYKQCVLEQNGQRRSIEIEQGRPQGKALAIKIKGVDDRNQSELLRKAQLLIAKEQLVALDDDEYYWHQLEGLAVYSSYSDAESTVQVEPVLLGRVSHLMATGSNDVLVVKGKSAKDGIDQRERLIPYRPEVIKKIDLEASSIEVDWDPEF